MNAFGYLSSGHTSNRDEDQLSNKYKTLVKVRAEHNTDGSIRPLSFYTPNGDKVVVDKLLNVCRAASLKAGGQGLRYEVRVTCGDTSRNLYLFDDDGV